MWAFGSRPGCDRGRRMCFLAEYGRLAPVSLGLERLPRNYEQFGDRIFRTRRDLRRLFRPCSEDAKQMADIDPITLATVWHSFQTLVREMRHMVTRTSQSYLMSQLKDVSVGIWLADGSTVAMPQGLLCQFMGTKFAIQAIKEKFGDDLHPGDVILTNDPYKGMNVHLPDWGFIRPIFHDGELLFFTLVRGHMMDTGGSFPGGYFPNSYDIHAEGLCIPPTKVFEKDQERKDVLDLI